MCICQLKTFFGEVFVQVFGPVLSCVVCFLIVEFWELLVYCGYKSFIRYMSCQYSLSFCGLSLHSASNFFHIAEVFIIMQSILLISFFHGSFFWCCRQTLSATYFISLCFTFWSKIYFELISIKSVFSPTWMPKMLVTSCAGYRQVFLVWDCLVHLEITIQYYPCPHPLITILWLPHTHKKALKCPRSQYCPSKDHFLLT